MATSLYWSDYSQWGCKIRSSVHNILYDYFEQRDLFRRKLDGIQLFVSWEEFLMLKDFDGDQQAYNIQIVSMMR